MIGETIKDFKLVARLGRGGMGEVWVAEQQIIQTKVAIKLLLSEISTDQQHVQRFFNEAIAVSRIKHAGIVKIYDVGFHTSGQAYLIMELLEGEPLASRIQRSGKLPLAQLADLGRQIASVLAATHAAGITHRDLKPDNIFIVGDAELASRERAKILDFGIAKLGTSTTISGLTATGNSMGTPAYMAPEQWTDAAKADARADVYSLGCLAFEMACGRPPFVASSIGEACQKHLHAAPPRVRALTPELPAELDAMVDRMLAKKPDDRPTMVEVGAMFAALGSARPAALEETLPPASMPAARAAAVSAAPVTATTLGTAAAAVDDGRADRAPRVRLIAAVAVVVAGAAAIYVARQTGRAPVTEPRADPAAAAASDAAAAAPAATPDTSNPFVAIKPSPVVLGLERDHPPANEHGFWPSRKIQSPSAPYAIQEHEVTWAEITPWYRAHGITPTYPEWVIDPTTSRAPATSVKWKDALAYCDSIGATLPTEAQWEFAARGPELRNNSWGDSLDYSAVRAFGGKYIRPAMVEDPSSPDHTPAQADGGRVFDLVGNVQEWTADLWREDGPGADEKWVSDGETTIRVLRGLPLGEDTPTSVQSVGAAYRERLCATGPCVEKTLDKLQFVGFRCAK